MANNFNSFRPISKLFDTQGWHGAVDYVSELPDPVEHPNELYLVYFNDTSGFAGWHVSKNDVWNHLYDESRASQEDFEQEIADRIAEDIRVSNESIVRDNTLQTNINQKESESIARDNTISQNSNRIEAESKQRDINLGVVINQKETESIARDFAIGETIVQKESESISRDGLLQNGITALGAFVNGNFIQKYPNKDFKDVLFPWDIGSLVIGGSVFSIEEISPIRIDLAYGASTKDLGLL